MIVSQLTWLSESAKEALLVISDGEYSCNAFSQPCDVKEGDNLQEPLHAFIIKDLMVSREINCSISLIDINTSRLAYKCVGEVINIESGLVKIGAIEIFLNQKAPHGSNLGRVIN